MCCTKSSSGLWALVDCNNFYASCEKLFRPDLARRPVVVLSNNDGCIVSRSAEAKKLGIPMGVPEFQWRQQLRDADVAVFSSNYALYGDISARICRILEQHCPKVEQYSIDEAFLRLEGALLADLPGFCRQLRDIILRWTGIAVSVGVGATRTLAKIASHIAKQRPVYEGVFSLARPEAQIDVSLRNTPVEEVWGIGRRQARRLWEENIRTALDLKRADDVWLRRELTVTGWRTALELRGLPCIAEATAPAPRRTLVSSRSFAQKVSSAEMLAQALSCFAARAGARLRREGLLAGGMAVHIRTSRHEARQCCDLWAQSHFVLPTDDSQQFIACALQGLKQIFRPGPGYAKAGVTLFELQERRGQQGNLLQLGREEELRQRQKLMLQLDCINARFGRDTIVFGAQGLGPAPWHMRQEHRSPRLTTHWQELPQVRC